MLGGGGGGGGVAEREHTFDGKCDRRNDGLWPTNGDGDDDDDERLDVLLSSSLLVRRYNSFSLKSAILMYEMLVFFFVIY